MPSTKNPMTRFNLTETGRGPWKLEVNEKKRAVVLRHKNGSKHLVYYGTRTERTVDDAMVQATALCAVLNHLKSKTC